MSADAQPWRALFEDGEVPEVPHACPRCGSSRVVPIIWGYPDSGVQDLVQRGEIELGGCVLPEHPEAWVCKACGRKGGEGST